jgi:hypothetical protein
MDSRSTPTLGTAAATTGDGGRPAAPSRSLRQRRRRPAVLAMSVALIAAGGLGGAVLYNATGQRIAVLALRDDVPYGKALTAQDLVIAEIASDPALAPVSADDLSRAIGRRATTDLHRGALLLAADITNAPVVQPGMQEVGVPVHTNQLPAEGVQVGQQIVFVQTGDNGGGPQTMNAVVAQTGKGGDSYVIDVAVPLADAVRMAQWASSGHFQVILAPRTGGAAPASASPSPSGSAGATPSPSGSA